MKVANLLARAVAIGCVAGGSLLVAVPAAPAVESAAPAPLVANLTRVSATSASNSVNKSVTVSCPAGLVVYGPGGQLTGGVGNVVLDAVIPSTTTVTARGVENGAYATNWTVTAFAVCGSPTTNHQVVRFASATNGTTPKNAQVDCPGTTRVFGTGFAITGAAGQIFPDRVSPDSNLNLVVARAARDVDSTSTATWNIAAYAVCANPASGMELITESVLPSSTSPKTVTPTCSAGKQLHGVGVLHTAVGNAVTDDFVPGSTLTSATLTVYENPPDFAGNWSITGHAICAF
ncbi:hypothetical protein WEI85_25685 [Actinomycetes bacterium KLBMP 9797]